jgi:hypothetical protein
MKYIIIILLTTLSSFAFAQKEIKVEDAKMHAGDTVRICTKIFGGKFLESSKGTPTFLNAGGNYPNAPLTLVIWADARKEFKNKPEEYFTGKDVCVTGKVEMFRDKPQIIILHETQIRETMSDKVIINEPR